MQFQQEPREESAALNQSFEPTKSGGNAAQPSAGRSPLSLEAAIKALEDSLPMGLEEGMQLYRVHRAQQPVSNQTSMVQGDAGVQKGLIPEDALRFLAQQVAEQVISTMAERGGLQDDSAEWRKRTDTLYADNRIMAEQVQRLISENEQLRNSKGNRDLELARYRHLAGNLYFKL